MVRPVRSSVAVAHQIHAIEGIERTSSIVEEVDSGENPAGWSLEQ